MSITVDCLSSARPARLPVLFGALALAALAGGCSRSDRPASPVAAMTVTVAELKAVELNRTVTANGTIYPWQEIIVGPEVGGYRVAAVNVDVGDHVRAGQELVRLSDGILSSELASKRANVEQAQATLENASAAYRRAASLSESGALSQSDLDRLRSEELTARARLAVSEADLDASELRLKHTHVTAPDDGIISSRTVAVGQVAQVGGEMLRMLRKGRVEWRAEIPESRVREIKVGQAVRLTTADGTELKGRVRTIAPTIESTTRSGLVYVDIPASSGAARPGMFARGELVLANASVQMAPVASVVIQDGYSYVFVVDAEQKIARRHVETGTVQDRLIEIVSGVQSGERVVDKGAGFLKDGDRVSVVPAQVE